ncbi:MAG: hypothetical protein U5M23_09795 [Marinagarivorans sp.]|nr:hypothetical protein [Marinagarivorans sp.]
MPALVFVHDNQQFCFLGFSFLWVPVPCLGLQAEQSNSLHYEASRINNELVQLLSIYRLQ